MRTSRDVVRPLVVLVVLLASLPLVTTVAAVRTQVTPHHRITCPQADAASGTTAQAQATQQCSTQRSQAARRESGESGERSEAGEAGASGAGGGGGATVVTHTGAS